MDVERMAAIRRDSEGLVHEAELSAAWHVPVKTLGIVRRARLREGLHWKLVNSGVMYTPEGEKELLARHIVPQDAPLKPQPPPVLPNDAPLSETVVMVQRLASNPRLLLCRNVHGHPVSVRVKDNRKFRTRMRIDLEAQCALDHHSHSPFPSYEFRGPLPRRPGRW